LQKVVKNNDNIIQVTKKIVNTFNNRIRSDCVIAFRYGFEQILVKAIIKCIGCTVVALKGVLRVWWAIYRGAAAREN